jgi:hypothetical protein
MLQYFPLIVSDSVDVASSGAGNTLCMLTGTHFLHRELNEPLD